MAPRVDRDNARGAGDDGLFERDKKRKKGNVVIRPMLEVQCSKCSPGSGRTGDQGQEASRRTCRWSMGLMKLCSVEGKAGDIEGTEYDRRGGVSPNISPCVVIHGEHGHGVKG